MSNNSWGGVYNLLKGSILFHWAKIIVCISELLFFFALNCFHLCIPQEKLFGQMPNHK